MEFVKAVTSDGLILQGLLAAPSKNTDTVILHIHGMAGNFWENGFIKTMLHEYPSQNIAFLSVELRGSEVTRMFPTTDGYRTIGNAYELFEDCVKDIDAWMAFLTSQGYNKIHLQGHSLGCSKIAYYQTHATNNAHSLILISPSDMLGLELEPKNLAEHKKLLAEATAL
ncbi:MAG: hypothetical protein AABY13_05940, partial [Nanoarchaeota archaeon]